MGGVLLGNAYKDAEGKTFIVINDIVIANFTKANLSRLTFTHDTWENIHKKIDQNHKDKIILGWFHSHPGHTVFLSSYDKFIHENYFNIGFMVAYVYDPVLEERGFFFWDNEVLVKAKTYFVFSTGANSVNKSAENKSDDTESKNQKSSILNIVLLVLVLLNCIFAVYLLFQYLQVEKDIKNNNELNLKISDLKNEIGNLNLKLEANKSQNDSIKNNISGCLIQYIIKPGDTLRKIAKKFYNDEEKMNLLVRFNNLKDEYDITTYQIIGIPLNN